MSEDKDKVKEMLIDAMKKAFEEKQSRPFQYVVAYYLTKDDTFLGYHSDSFCNLTQEQLSGKRYSGDNPYEQLAIIRKNLDYTLDMTAEKAENTIFGALNLSTKARYFDGLAKEDVYIMAEYLDDDIPPQKFVYQKITKDE